MIESRKIPNYFLYFTLGAVEEIMGTSGLHAILNVTGLVKFKDNSPPNDQQWESDATDISRLLRGVSDLVGHNGAKAILRRAGGRGFQLSIEESPELMAGLGTELKKLPSDRDRISTLMGATTYDTNRIFGEGHQEFVPVDGGFEVRIAECEWCWGTTGATSPICFTEVGFEEAAIFWATGKSYEVTEVQCRAQGADRCIFHISGSPRE